MQIAIDGPIAAGKGTVAKLVANKLGFLYVDTGALFRAVSFLCHSQKIDLQHESEVCALLTNSQPVIELKAPSEDQHDGRLCTVLLNHIDVSWDIRTSAHSHGASTVSRYLCVRDYLLTLQQQLAQQQNVVMEGRDIGTFVLPKADLKIYLTGGEETRARRRYQELLLRGESVTFEKVLADLRQRDHMDMMRKLRPLVKAEDAVEVDTTNLTIDEVVAKIVSLVPAG